MRLKIITILFPLLFMAFFELSGQCRALGQTPATAFPICGTTAFNQTTVPLCTNKPMLVPGCEGNNADYADKNPFWYRFTCYQAGTLGLLITPANLGDDYDWQLYDITGVTNLNEVYTNRNLFVTANWSGSSGLTGTSSTAANNIECGSDPADNIPTFSKMPTLILDHTYLLMISHYSNSQSGYQLSFNGGTAIITDPKLPGMQSVKTPCDASTISVKLDKKMKCSSLAGDGSDFTISPAAATIVSATGVGCNNGFDMDSVILTLSNPLPPANYTITVKTGVDGNTLLDNCDRNIPVGNNILLAILPLAPTPMDSLTTIKCAPDEFQLVFSKKIRCNSIAADGSDFIVTGPGTMAVISARGNCADGLSDKIFVKLSSALVLAGTYQLQLKRGTDGNTIIDECAQETPAGSSLSFTIKDTVSASFSYNIFMGCKSDTVVFAHDGRNSVNQWLWNFGAAGGVSAQQNPSFIYTNFGTKQIQLIVSNGFCSDTATQTVFLDNELKANFETNNLLCPEDAASFVNKSIGSITEYNWDFGNGATSLLKTPPSLNYPKTGIEKTYTVRLVVKNAANCFDTSYNKIKVLKTCYIAVPTAFTPNGDGINDYLYPLNAYKADGLEFHVYNRLGQLIFHTTDWTQKWDGKINGTPQNSGTFAWTLSYTNRDNGQKFFLKGTTILIR